MLCMRCGLIMLLTSRVHIVEAEQETAWREELISILSNIPQSVCVVMRYLFAFLNQYVL